MPRFRPFNVVHCAGAVWGLSAGVIVVALWSTGLFRRLELVTYDLRLRAAAGDPLPEAPQIAVIGIDEPDIEERGPLPWNRGDYAKLVRMLHRAGAKAIAFDMYFEGEGPDHEDGGDDEFAQACREAGNVVFGIHCRDPLLRQQRRADGVYWGERLNGSLPEIVNAVAGIGHLNVFYDQDSVARAVFGRVGNLRDGHTYFPLAMRTAMAYWEATGTWPPGIAPNSQEWPQTIPSDGRSRLLINYLDFENHIDHFDSALVRELYQRANGGVGKPIVLHRFLDVWNGLKNGTLPADEFDGKVVLTGMTVHGSEQDLHSTPFGRRYGVFIQAILIHDFLTRRFLCSIRPGITVGAIMGISFFLGLLCFKVRLKAGNYWLIVTTLLLAFALLGAEGYAAVWLFRAKRLVLEVVPFMALTVLHVAMWLAPSLGWAGKKIDAKDRQLEMMINVGNIATGDSGGDDQADDYVLFPLDPDIASCTVSNQNAAEAIVDTVEVALNCEGYGLYVCEEDSASDALAVYRCETGSLSQDVASELSEAIGEHAPDQLGPIMLNDLSSNETYSHLGEEIRSFLSVPLEARRRKYGTLAFFNKVPSELSPTTDFTEEDARLAMMLAKQVAITLHVDVLYRDMHETFLDYIKSIAAAVDARDAYTHGHSRRVADFAVGTARELGVTDAELEIIELAGTVHDIGKIGIPEEVLNKPGRLTDEEFAIMRSHVIRGETILSPMRRLRMLMPAVRNHHEKYDGSGYPDHFAGEDISPIARIIGVGDAFDAMASTRVYRKGMELGEALRRIRNDMGTHFDPVAAEAFFRYVETDPPEVRALVEAEAQAA